MQNTVAYNICPQSQIFRNILNLNKYNPDNLEEEDDPPFFWRDIKS